MLRRLSGREHEVYTGVTVMKDGGIHCGAERTSVRFRALTPGEIAAYVATGEPMDKAGAYAPRAGVASLSRASPATSSTLWACRSAGWAAC